MDYYLEKWSFFVSLKENIGAFLIVSNVLFVIDFFVIESSNQNIMVINKRTQTFSS